MFSFRKVAQSLQNYTQSKGRVTYTLMAFLLIFHDLTTHYARFPFVFQIFCSEWGLLFTTYQIWPFPPTKETKIGDEGASGLGSGLGKCTNLSNLTLYLSYNKIGDEGASGLGSGLGKCTNLSNLTLYLEDNQIGDEGASGLGSGLGKCTNLSNLTLDLEDNQIGDEGASGLGKCTNLSNLTLYLRQNKMNSLQQLKAKCHKSNRLVVLKFNFI
ncbi:transmembrane protein, putative (macronuclear) [Tetrahymena thermophila SB210]|uniref:Transmembrane protein, putative n=1 Tax=Tetrahymena thermophila (strain SB210) TaxID=312017 RepID=X1W3N9_TETTS|nr:transmembrane protein, putative [Tetrahymena thermophila SB210]EAS06614.3 transmembrane protein, putative [Tetrahymena thermophila SB210]|eukprot:XP_001026859.3 transmembrane protein, putative [Tetrahymena thermophila SB210]